MRHICFSILIILVFFSSVLAEGQKRLSDPPFSFNISNGDGEFILHWKNPAQSHYSSICIYRKSASSVAERNMREMERYTEISGDQQEFVDHDVVQGQLYIYALQGVSRDKQPGRFSTLRTAILSDKSPPAQVAAPKAEISKKAVVTLHWQPVPDKDVVTYQIYRGLDGIRSLQPVRIILAKKPPLYQEQLDPKSPAAYIFAIRAIDGSGNQSPLSDTVSVEVKDIRPPEKPFLTALRPTSKNVELTWAPSSSPDVAGYNIYRSTDNWKTRLKLNKDVITLLNYADSGTKFGTKYRYYVTAIDKAGNESKDSGDYSCRSIEEYEVVAPEGLKLRKNKLNTPQLHWKTMGDEVHGYLVERRPVNAKDFRQISGLLNENTFTDPDKTADTDIEYRLRSLYMNGQISPPSDPVLWKTAKKQERGKL